MSIQIVPTECSNSGYQAGQSSYSWSHTTFDNEDRILIVGVSLLSVAGNQVSSITYNGTPLTFIRADTSTSTLVRTELWYLLQPILGTKTIAVTLSTSTDSVSGGAVLSGVSQINPINVQGGSFGLEAVPASIFAVLTPITGDSSGYAYGFGIISTSDTAVTSADFSVMWNVTGALGSAIGGTDTNLSLNVAFNVMQTSADVQGAWTISAVILTPSGSKPTNIQQYIVVGNGMSRNDRAS